MGNLEGGVVGLGTCGFVGKGLVAAVCFGPDEKTGGWLEGVLVG